MPEVKFSKLMEKIAHSENPEGVYIICGPAGVGKNKLANQLIKLLIAQPSLNSVFKLEPQIISKRGVVKEKKISVEQVRQAIDFMQLKSPPHSFMVCLIKRAELLSKGAGNALLKSLEEIKRGKVFILIAEAEDKLLKTIKSRSVIIRVGFSHPGFILKNLLEKSQSVSLAEKAAYYSWGRPDYADNILKDSSRLSTAEEIEDNLCCLIKAPLYQRFKILEKEKGNRKLAQEKIDHWISFLVINLEQQLIKELNCFKIKRNINYPLKETVILLEKLLDLKKRLASSNASHLLALEATWL